MLCDPLSGVCGAWGGNEAWACLVVTVQCAVPAVPEGGDGAWACLVVTVQHAVPAVSEGVGRAWVCLW